jgi:N-carbamoyl-L-amino-acid hydrolase
MEFAASELRIDSRRMKKDFEELSRIGATDDGGIHRPAFSQAHLQARDWFVQRAARMGIESRVDGAGNHQAVLPCGKTGAARLMLGSHLDSVPFGGRFDGALGVVAALEVLETVKENGISLDLDLCAVDFTDEEGAFVGLMGSRALSGRLPRQEVDHPSGSSDEFHRALARAGISPESIFSAAAATGTFAGYLELHVEQGTRLKDAGADIGVVTGIVGIRNFRFNFNGRADHAGTTPMDRRRDAGLGACSLVLQARQRFMQNFPGCVVTAGNIDFRPGAFNVVTQTASVNLEFRADDIQTLDAMETAVYEEAGKAADDFGLDLTIETLERTVPVHLDDSMQKALTSATEKLGLFEIHLPSGAGHDAQAMALICPAGMIFVPSENGASHSCREFTRWQDCVSGANVLLQAALSLAGARIF